MGTKQIFECAHCCFNTQTIVEEVDAENHADQHYVRCECGMTSPKANTQNEAIHFWNSIRMNRITNENGAIVYSETQVNSMPS